MAIPPMTVKENFFWEEGVSSKLRKGHSYILQESYKIAMKISHVYTKQTHLGSPQVILTNPSPDIFWSRANPG